MSADPTTAQAMSLADALNSFCLVDSTLVFATEEKLLEHVFEALHVIRNWPATGVGSIQEIALLDDYLAHRLRNADLAHLTAITNRRPFGIDSTKGRRAGDMRDFSLDYLQRFDVYEQAWRHHESCTVAARRASREIQRSRRKNSGAVDIRRKWICDGTGTRNGQLANTQLEAARRTLVDTEKRLEDALFSYREAIRVTVFIALLTRRVLERLTASSNKPAKREDERISSAEHLLPSLSALLGKEDLGYGKVALLPYYYLAADGELQAAYRIQVSGLGMLIYALAVCLDDRFDFGRRLCHCSLPECGRLFLTSPPPGGGRPRRRYCSEDHMDKMHNRKAAERVAAWRIRNKPVA